MWLILLCDRGWGLFNRHFSDFQVLQCSTVLACAHDARPAVSFDRVVCSHPNWEILILAWKWLRAQFSAICLWGPMIPHWSANHEPRLEVLLGPPAVFPWPGLMFAGFWCRWSQLLPLAPDSVALLVLVTPNFSVRPVKGSSLGILISDNFFPFKVLDGSRHDVKAILWTSLISQGGVKNVPSCPKLTLLFHSFCLILMRSLIRC